MLAKAGIDYNEAYLFDWTVKTQPQRKYDLTTKITPLRGYWKMRFPSATKIVPRWSYAD